MTKLLIAVAGCQRDRDIYSSIKAKWAFAQDIADTRFFFGGNPVDEMLAGESQLEVLDGYLDLPYKVKAICQWALDWGYTHVFKTDVDVTPFERRFREFDFAKYDYAGSCFPRDHYPPVHCSGFGYFLSRRAMRIVADFDVSGYQFEDRMVGDALRPHIMAGSIKQHNIKWMVAAAGESNNGEPPI